jgi:hypothetical protein
MDPRSHGVTAPQEPLRPNSAISALSVGEPMLRRLKVRMANSLFVFLNRLMMRRMAAVDVKSFTRLVCVRARLTALEQRAHIAGTSRGS